MSIEQIFKCFTDKYLNEDEKNFVLSEIFFTHIKSLPLRDSEISNICEAIVNVQTNNKKGYRGLGKARVFNREPLKKLRKVHCDLVRLESLTQNAFKDDVRVLQDGTLEITNQGWKEIQEIGLENFIQSNSKKLDYKTHKNQKTGYWLIYGELQGINHYLYLHLGLHENEDDLIYENLLSMYSLKLINNLKSGK